MDSQRPSAPERPVPVPTLGRAPYSQGPLIQHGLTSRRIDNLPKDHNSRRNKGGTRFAENEKQLESQTTPAAKLTAAGRAKPSPPDAPRSRTKDGNHPAADLDSQPSAQSPVCLLQKFLCPYRVVSQRLAVVPMRRSLTSQSRGPDLILCSW